jgi:spermidine synthase
LLIIISFAFSWQLNAHFAKPIHFFADQKDYEDKVVFTSETQFHKLVITQWQDDHWFFIDKLKNICSIDEYLFYEPMVHGAMSVTEHLEEVLVLGGENGCLVRELLKYDQVKRVHIVSYDTLLRNLGAQNPYFTSMNQNSTEDPRVKFVKGDLLEFVSGNTKKYDMVFIDLPDPRSIEANQYYTIEFYSMLKRSISNQAVMVAQAGSPYFATQAFFSIAETLKAVGFEVLPIHNQILTLGEWGWYICSLEKDEETMRNLVINSSTSAIETRWWNEDAAKLVTSFGKTYADTLNVGINTLENPVVYQYYLKGNWDME